MVPNALPASASRNKRAGARASTLNGNVNQPSAQPSSLNPEGDGRIMPTPFPDDCELIQRVDQWETKVHSDVARMPEPVPYVTCAPCSTLRLILAAASG